MTTESTPACLDCSTCCFSNLERYVRVSGFDHGRLGDAADALTTFVGNRCYMKMHQGHCAALVVDAETAHFVCSIYDARPGVCRELERDSGACHGEIHEKGDRPVALLRLLARRP